MKFDEVQTEMVADAARQCGYRSPRQFVEVWCRAGYPLLQPSERKRMVYRADIKKFLEAASFNAD